MGVNYVLWGHTLPYFKVINVENFALNYMDFE